MNFLPKMAYPNYDDYNNHVPPRNTEKWVNLISRMYAEIHAGIPRKEAVAKITSDLDKMEKIDFLNWLRFYEENAHKKYASEDIGYVKNKFANGYYLSDDFYLPGEQTFRESNGVSGSQSNSVDNAMSTDRNKDIIESSKKEEIEKYKKKILARLHAVEKLLTSHNTGSDLFGDEYNGFIQSLLRLRQQVLMLNKQASSNKIYKDIIIREANKLKNNGYSNSYNILVKVADTLPPPPAAPSPTDMGGLPGVMTQNPIPKPQSSGQQEVSFEPEENQNEAISKFLGGMNNGGIVVDDINTVSDADLSLSFYENFEDEDDNDSIYVAEDDVDDTDNFLLSEAQAPLNESVNKKNQPLAGSAIQETNQNKKDESQGNTEVLSVKEDVADDTASSEFESYIDKAFEMLSVSDVINKLDDLVKIFKAREIPRQLSVVDMMLDRLGLGTYFPSLAEATTKSLESNQYILSRIEDVVSRLRGSLESEEVDLSSKVRSEISDAETLKVKNDLQQKSEKEKERKKIKKELEDKSIDDVAESKEKPEIEVKEDMSGPVSKTTEMPQSMPNQSPQQPAQVKK